jgi:hypothetical protein
MIDDPLEWLAVTLDEEDPTIPDELEWRDSLELDDETHRTTVLDDDEPPEAEWELELESDLRPRFGVTHG